MSLSKEEMGQPLAERRGETGSVKAPLRVLLLEPGLCWTPPFLARLGLVCKQTCMPAPLHPQPTPQAQLQSPEVAAPPSWVTLLSVPPGLTLEPFVGSAQRGLFVVASSCQPCPGMPLFSATQNCFTCDVLSSFGVKSQLSEKSQEPTYVSLNKTRKLLSYQTKRCRSKFGVRQGWIQMLKQFGPSFVCLCVLALLS